MALFTEHADVSVRPAIERDAAELARIQHASWAQTIAEPLGADTLESLDLDAMAEQWRTAITTPPGPGFSVLTALAAQQVVGFCAVSPELIVAFEVDPLHQREGHGSRLLSAAVDRLRQDGANSANVWLPRDAQAKQQFFASAGFGEAGRIRHLQVSEDREIVEERWTALIGG
jgi:GNAT superfamily N-acetyltransferase